MKKVYAVCGGRTSSYITPGKKYEAFSSGRADFLIKDDEGDLIPCMWNNCAHLNGGNWTRIEEDDEAKLQDQKTLRDEFAISWLLGYMSNPDTPELTHQQAAECAYKMADAMLEARKK